MTNSNYYRKEGRQSVRAKLIVAFIAFALIVGVKAISSKSTNDGKDIHVSIID